MLKTTLLSAINQTTTQDYEIVVVDNEAIDSEESIKTDTQIVIEECLVDNLFYYRNKVNVGMTGNWNQGIKLARGEYITILHDDDWLEPNFLEEVDKKICGNQMLIFKPRIRDYRDCEGSEKKIKTLKRNIRGAIDNIFKSRKINAKDYFLRNPAYGTLGVVLNREVVCELGGFDEKLYPIMDYALLFQYCCQEGAFLSKKKVTNYRIAQNESLKVAKVTPKAMYDYRKCVYQKESSYLKKCYKYIDELYVHDIDIAEKAWGCCIEKPIFYEEIKNSVKYKLFKVFFSVYILFRV